MHIVSVHEKEWPDLAAYLRIGDKAYPIASYDHLTAPTGSILSYKGPLYAALYQGERLTQRQKNIIEATLKRDPDYLHKLHATVASATSYRVLFNNELDKSPSQNRKRKRS